MGCEMPQSLRDQLIPEAVLMMDLFFMNTAFGRPKGCTQEQQDAANVEMAELLNVKALEFMDEAKEAGFTEQQLRDRAGMTTWVNDNLGRFILSVRNWRPGKGA